MAEHYHLPDVKLADLAAWEVQKQLLGQQEPEHAAFQNEIALVESPPFYDLKQPRMTRHDFLEELHRLFQPRTYLEIGVDKGESLALSQTRTIAVDPFPGIDFPISCDLELVERTSGDFFAANDPIKFFEGAKIDLAFIDGMHLSDYAIRDFVNVERYCAPGSIVVFDDVLPRNDLEADRIRRTQGWAGDIFRVIGVLEEYRPDLVLIPLDTSPTGSLVVTNLDPQNGVLTENLEGIQNDLQSTGPTQVPEGIRTRSIASDPLAFLSSTDWGAWIAERDYRSPYPAGSGLHRIDSGLTTNTAMGPSAISDRQVSRLSKRVYDTEQVLLMRDRDVAELQGSLALREHDVSDLRAALELREHDLNELNILLVNSQECVEDLLARSAESRQGSERTERNLRSLLEAASSRLSDANSRIAAMEQSRSWRMSAPLRVGGELARRLR